MHIHSFILNIYIAPLQENYSEALSTPTSTAKTSRLHLRKNAGDKALGKITEAIYKIQQPLPNAKPN